MSKLLKKAIEIASLLDKNHGKQRVCAIVVDKQDRVLSIATNSYEKTSPFMYRYAKRAKLENKIFWHAECKAISQLKHSDKAHKIYVARVSKSGEVGYAAPCPVCAEAIKDTNIKVIEHTV